MCAKKAGLLLSRSGPAFFVDGRRDVAVYCVLLELELDDDKPVEPSENPDEELLDEELEEELDEELELDRELLEITFWSLSGS